MRYLFRGLLKATGQDVEGHVEADNDEIAYQLLSERGIVCGFLRPDPKPLNLAPVPAPADFANAIDSAMDSASSQIDFDSLTDRYKGKKVWVIDRDKIRMRTAQVVDAALAQAAMNYDSPDQARARVADAIRGMFADNRNLASERPADVANNPTAAAAGNGAAVGGAPSQAMQDIFNDQMSRLERIINQMESLLASLTLAGRSLRYGGGGGGGAGGPRRSMFERSPMSQQQSEALLEIFRSNLELVKSMKTYVKPGDPAPPPAAAPGNGQPTGN